MVAIFDHKLGDLRGLASLERYLRGSREHLEGFGGVWKGI